MLRSFASGWLDLLAPPQCAECGKAQVRCPASDRPPALCPTCLARIPRLACTCFSDPVDPSAPGCLACAGWGAALPRCRSTVVYGAGSQAWMRRFKYPRPGPMGLDPSARRVVEEWVRAAVLRRPDPPPDAVVPVPLHPRRLRERGFNPAALLARAVARQLGRPLASPTLLVRRRDTPSQTPLDREARRVNVAGAFRSEGPKNRGQETLLLVDDVATTGATLVAAARALRQAGYRHIDAICAARTPAQEEIKTRRRVSSP